MKKKAYQVPSVKIVEIQQTGMLMAASGETINSISSGDVGLQYGGSDAFFDDNVPEVR